MALSERSGLVGRMVRSARSQSADIISGSLQVILWRIASLVPLLGYLVKALLGWISTIKPKEGFSMSSQPDFRGRCRSGFRQVVDAFLSQPGHPFTRLFTNPTVPFVSRWIRRG